MLGDHILYSHGLSDGEGVDITKRNLTLITIGALRVQLILCISVLMDQLSK